MTTKFKTASPVNPIEQTVHVAFDVNGLDVFLSEDKTSLFFGFPATGDFGDLTEHTKVQLERIGFNEYERDELLDEFLHAVNVKLAVKELAKRIR